MKVDSGQNITGAGVVGAALWLFRRFVKIGTFELKVTDPEAVKKIAKLEADISELKKTINKSSEEKFALRLDLQVAKERIASLEETKSEMHEELVRLRARLDER